MVFFIYNLLLIFTSPVWAAWMYFRSLKRKPALNWRERMANYDLPPSKGRRRIWLHSVSVGEFLASIPVLEEIRRQLPTHEIIVSCTTSSGHLTAEQANQKRIENGEKPLYEHLIYFPLDIARFTLSALQQIQPEVIILMESELWLNFLWAAKTFESRVILMNGRISDRSFPRMKKLKWFYGTMLKDINRALMQSKVDGDRIHELGFESPEVIGNCKFEQALPNPSFDPEKVRQFLGISKDRILLVIGSTRSEMEELFVFEALDGLRKIAKVPFSVIYAPRHIERSAFVLTAAKSHGFNAQLRSEIPGSFNDPTEEKESEVDLWVLDTYGELSLVYGAGSIAVVGGGFDRLGGQNILQPLGWGKPVIFGPHMENFADASSQALRSGCGVQCSTQDELTKSLAMLINDATKRYEMSVAAKRLVEVNIGSVKRFGTALKSEVQKYEKIQAQYEQRRKERLAARKN